MQAERGEYFVLWKYKKIMYIWNTGLFYIFNEAKYLVYANKQLL